MQIHYHILFASPQSHKMSSEIDLHNRPATDQVATISQQIAIYHNTNGILVQSLALIKILYSLSCANQYTRL